MISSFKKWYLPLVPQEVTIKRGRLRHIIGGGSLIGSAQEDIWGKLTANNGNIRREVHPHHTQHALSLYVSHSTKPSARSVTLTEPMPNFTFQLPLHPQWKSNPIKAESWRIRHSFNPNTCQPWPYANPRNPYFLSPLPNQEKPRSCVEQIRESDKGIEGSKRKTERRSMIIRDRKLGF